MGRRSIRLILSLGGFDVYFLVVWLTVLGLLAGAGITWFIALYTQPKYEQYQKEIMKDREGKETKAMKAWNKKQMNKKRKGKKGHGG